jgi:hypothetical protein
MFETLIQGVNTQIQFVQGNIFILIFLLVTFATLLSKLTAMAFVDMRVCLRRLQKKRDLVILVRSMEQDSKL